LFICLLLYYQDDVMISLH